MAKTNHPGPSLRKKKKNENLGARAVPTPKVRFNCSIPIVHSEFRYANYKNVLSVDKIDRSRLYPLSMFAIPGEKC